MKEAFTMGDDATEPESRAPSTVKSTATSSSNSWPSSCPEFRPVMYEYFHSVTMLSKKLMQIFALALDLPEDYFDAATSFPMGAVRILHYPPQPVPGAADIGLGAHTDYDFFTLVLQESVEALQVLNANGIWIDAPPRPHSYVVNIGDFLSRITNDKFKSTVHRVVNKSGKERYSMPYFFSPNKEATLATVPTCIEGDNKYEAVNAGEYLRERLIAARYQHPAAKEARAMQVAATA